MNAPVGVFDSGVGGLSVALEIRQMLPDEDLLYFADTEYCPYGGRPLEEVRDRSIYVVSELVARGAKVVVVACNTASGAALELLRERFRVPIVGLEPAVKPAVAMSPTGRIGVMATANTLRSDRFARLVEAHAAGAVVMPQACPGLVEVVESGATSGEAARRMLVELTRPLREAEVDVVVLGCTHYPFLREEIEEVMGPDVRIVDSGAAVARQVQRVLTERDALATAGGGGLRMLTSGDPRSLAEVAARLWGAPVPIEQVARAAA